MIRTIEYRMRNLQTHFWFFYYLVYQAYDLTQECCQTSLTLCFGNAPDFTQAAYTRGDYSILAFILITRPCTFVIETAIVKSFRYTFFISNLKQDTAPLDLIFEDCVYFLKKLWTKYPVNLIRKCPTTQKSQFYVSRNHGCKVNVNNVWKSIFSMF